MTNGELKDYKSKSKLKKHKSKSELKQDIEQKPKPENTSGERKSEEEINEIIKETIEIGNSLYHKIAELIEEAKEKKYTKHQIVACMRLIEQHYATFKKAHPVVYELLVNCGKY